MELPPKHVRFTHTPLNFKNKEIRLITIEPTADPSSPIQITIKNADFSGHSDALARCQEEVARLQPGPLRFNYLSTERKRSLRDEFLQGKFRFIALSYTWGPELPAQDMLVTSPECRGWISIRQNLYEFLKARRDWLLVPQSGDDLLEVGQDPGSSSFWIDQICINQEKNDEKAHQVNQMADIYNAAFFVEVWLGTGFEGSDGLVDLIIHESNSFRQYLEPRLKVTEREMRALIPSLGQFLCLPYWSRLWVTQEIVLGRLVTIRIGSKILLWENFYQGLLRLKRAWDCLCSTEEHGNLKNEAGKGMLRIYEINSSRGFGNKDWNSVRGLLRDTECSDLRDRVFGMMGMLGPSFRVFPDYSMHPEEVLLMLLTKVVQVWYNKNIRCWAFDYHPSHYQYDDDGYINNYSNNYVGLTPHETSQGEFWRAPLKVYSTYSIPATNELVCDITKECVRTAVNWLPQLEDDKHRIDPKTVRHHLLKIIPFNPLVRNWKARRTHYLMRHPTLRNVPVIRKVLLRMSELEWEFYHVTRETWRLKYYIWKNIPNERNMLWRLVRADYKRLEHVSIPSVSGTDVPEDGPSCLFADCDV